MGIRIHSNILALSAQRYLSATTRALQRAMSRLASGSRISGGRDDPAGLSIAVGLESQRRGLLQATRNLNDAKGFLGTAEGAMQVQAEIVQRMRELALQASNGTIGSDERSYLDTELQQLVSEFKRIAAQTEFNGVNLLDGSFSTRQLQVGSAKGSAISFSVSSMQATAVFTLRSTVGTGTFMSRKVVGTGTNPQSVFSEDFNGDGYADLVTSDAGGTLSILIGQGDGTFLTRTTAVGGSGAYLMVTAADLDDDGELDLISNDYSGDLINIALGNGNGTFQARRTIAGGTFPASVTVADYNRDGKLDLITADYVARTVSLYVGNGNGTFQASTTLNFVTNTHNDVEVVDINNDNILDIVSSSTSAGGFIHTVLGNGNGTFGSLSTLSSGGGPRQISMADINGDGNLDILAADNIDNDLSIFLGNGNGTFQTRTTVATGTSPFNVTAVDLNGDTYVDLMVADSGSSTASILLGNGNGTFRTRTTVAVGNSPYVAIAADINADGVYDLVTADRTDNAVSIAIANTTVMTSNPELTIATQETAENLLEVFDNALSYINSARANIGALQSRLDFAESINRTTVENISDAKSRVADTDFSQETAEFTKLLVLQQGGISVLGHANLNAKLALKLLENI